MVRKMRFNDFQKNGLLKINSVNNSSNTQNSSGQLGRRSIQEIRDDMWKAKQKPEMDIPKPEQKLFKVDNPQRKVEQRVEALKRLDRWKG